MTLAHEQLTGLDRDRVVAVVEPILRAHSVEGVELVWKTDRSGWVLALTIEKSDSPAPGAGVTIDLCSEISRDLSSALDVAEVISQRYRLEVGSPGVERGLYRVADFARFAGQAARIKLREPLDGRRVLEGKLQGVREPATILLSIGEQALAVEFETIDSARLLFDWGGNGAQAGGIRSPRNGRRGGKAARSRRSK